MIPGEIIPADAAPLAANTGLPALTLDVTNTGDRPIQVGSHFHFAETNSALRFDRAAARGGVRPRDRGHQRFSIHDLHVEPVHVPRQADQRELGEGEALHAGILERFRDEDVLRRAGEQQVRAGMSGEGERHEELRGRPAACRAA